MKCWVIVTPDGEKLTWWETWQARLSRRFPKVNKDGMIWLDGKPYVPDPNRYVREYYHPRKYLGLVRKEDVFQYWIQNEPDAVQFDKSLTPGSIGITGDTIAQYAKSQHLRRLVEPETNWLLIGFICLIIGIMAGAIGYSVGIQQGIGR